MTAVDSELGFLQASDFSNRCISIVDVPVHIPRLLEICLVYRTRSGCGYLNICANDLHLGV
jgi:hypothetical protein